MTPIDIQVSRSKVKPILYMLGKGGISVLQTSIFTMTLRTVLVQNIEFCVVVCNFDDYVDRLVYFERKNYRNF